MGKGEREKANGEKDTLRRHTAFLSCSTNCRAQEYKLGTGNRIRIKSVCQPKRTKDRGAGGPKDEQPRAAQQGASRSCFRTYMYVCAVHTTPPHNINSHKRNALKLEQTVIALDQLTHPIPSHHYYYSTHLRPSFSHAPHLLI